MGGGLGYYYGEFTRKIEGAEFEVTQRKFALGIHVSASMDYMITDYMSARFEMKFRDPEFNVIGKYNNTSGTQLPDEEFETKVDVNGLTFMLGAAFHF